MHRRVCGCSQAEERRWHRRSRHVHRRRRTRAEILLHPSAEARWGRRHRRLRWPKRRRVRMRRNVKVVPKSVHAGTKHVARERAVEVAGRLKARVGGAGRRIAGSRDGRLHGVVAVRGAPKSRRVPDGTAPQSWRREYCTRVRFFHGTLLGYLIPAPRQL